MERKTRRVVWMAVAAVAIVGLMSLLSVSSMHVGAPDESSGDGGGGNPDEVVGTYGDDPMLDALWDACAAGIVDACAQLYQSSPLGSEYEIFALDRFPTPADAVLAYERLLKEQLEPGSIVYSAPQEMQVGDRATVTARITREDLEGLDGATDEIFDGLTSDNATILTEQLQVGTSIRATLEGDGWDVTPIGPETQMLRLTGHREWEWRIEPLEGGELTLYLTVYVSHDGQDIDNVSLEREIAVTVNPLRSIREFITSNWQWILTTLVGSGALAALGRRYGARQRERSDVAAEPVEKESVSSDA